MIYQLIITFILFLVIVIIALQNSTPLELKLLMWHPQMSLTALIFYSSLVGAAIVAVLALPKLVSKSFKVRHLNREIAHLEKRAARLVKENAERSAEGPDA
jgi:uncharacterized integral membrane protein